MYFLTRAFEFCHNRFIIKPAIYLLPFLFVSCFGVEEYSEEMYWDDLMTDTTASEDIMEVDEEFPPYEAKAYLDGPDEWFYVYNDDDKIPMGEKVHITPQGYGSDAHAAYDFMLAIVDIDFNLGYDPLKNYTGTVTAYYDVAKTVEVCSYHVSNGKPNGVIQVKNPDGEIIIDRIYEYGVWKGAAKDQACVDWEFDQQQSSLIINDLQNGDEMIDGQRVISLRKTFNANNGDHNNLYAIMQKESFRDTFRINEEPFTGKLMAYFSPKQLEMEPYYELNFRNGLLHGIVNIYNDWDELELKESFVDGELDSVLYKLNYEEMDGVAKPIIYFYPETEMDLSVSLDFNGRLTHTYPKYPPGGWKVHVQEDGTIVDGKGQEYYSLYWEGKNHQPFHITEGAAVKGDQTVEFLETSLAQLGLNRREANEFIIYWLPHLESSPYNLIHFSTTEYEEMAKLRISPEPETVIRVMMVFQPMDTLRSVKSQDLSKLGKKRKGFTVVEWGGKKIDLGHGKTES